MLLWTPKPRVWMRWFVDLVGISLCVEPGQACYIPLAHKVAGGDDLFSDDALAPGQMPF